MGVDYWIGCFFHLFADNLTLQVGLYNLSYPFLDIKYALFEPIKICQS